MNIGDLYGGGIVFYLDQVNKIGMSASVADLPSALWRYGLSADHPYVGSLGQEIGDGKTNTDMIVAYQGPDGSYAAKSCADYSFAGFTDWYLPSLNEALALYAQKEILGFNTGEFYWCSTEVDNDNALIVNLSFGTSYLGMKYDSHKVRAIRSFIIPDAPTDPVPPVENEVFTIRKALTSTINFPLPDSAIDKALIDADLTGSDIYTKADAKAVGVCMAGLLFTLLTSADVNEDYVYVKLPQRDVLLKVYSAICQTWGIPDAFAPAKPTVKQVLFW